MSLSLTPLAQLPPPLEGYTLIERLGRGGFGEVWKAEAPGGLLKAIKFVFGDLDGDMNEEENRPARQEEKALQRVKNIRHPYVLSLERYDKIDGQLVIVMELAERNLWDRFRECHALGMGGIPREELMRYMEETAEAIDLMNNHYKIQHLDIKPQNLFLLFNHVKVGDFGLAKVLEGVRGTITGGVTPVYAGPETFNGDVSRFTDQYSLAIVYQEMLTGKRPFNGQNTKQLVMQHLTGLPDLEPLPVSDREVIAKGLAKDPEARWPSCSELVKALKQAGSVATTPAPIQLQRRVQPTPTPQPSVLSAQLTAARTGMAQRRFGSPPVALADPAPSSTPVPAGTPKLITPQAASSGRPNPMHTLARPVVMPTARMSSLGLVAPERAENGVLMPALVVGLGEMGIRSLQQVRATVIERFGTLDAAPHVKFLAIDTDAALTAELVSVNNPHAMPVNEVIHTKLNRPAHYLNRDGLAPVEPWMPPGVLYQLPRDPQPAKGVRAFGRLALADHIRTIVQRVRQHVESFVNDHLLDAAAKESKLGVRSNRARVYILANLAGGSGSGMAVDVAAIVRHELRQIGYANPDCVGMLFVPPADVRGQALANTYAALVELRHFHNGRHRYSVRFDNQDATIADGDGPFRRVALLQLHKRAEPKEQQRIAGLAARAIFLDLFTPVGRRCDEVRAEAAKMNTHGVPVVQPFGLYRLSWPRPAVLAASTRRFGQRLIQRWLTRDTAHLREPITAWLDENWTKKKLTLELVVDRYHAAIKADMGEDADTVMGAFLEPLRAQALARRLEPQAAADTIHRILALVGKPDEERELPGKIHTLLAAANTAMSKDVEATLYNWTGWFVEQPLYRLPGAEEAVSQIGERIKGTLAVLEPTRLDLAHEVYEAYGRVLNLLGTLGVAGRGVIGPSRASVGAELLDTVRHYAKKRVTLMVLDVTLSLYRSTAGVLPDCLREVGEIRNRLLELSTSAGGGSEPINSPGPGRMILPHGVSNLDGAADLFIGALPVQDIIDFEKDAQTQIAKKFGGVVGLSTKPTHRAEFLPWLSTLSRQFLDARLETTDPATVFFRHKEQGEKAEKLLMQAFEDAAPDVTSGLGKAQTEATILAAPESADGERLGRMLATLIPDIGIIPATLTDDIVVLREYPLLPLDEVPQLGPLAREAYDAQRAGDVSPHSRSDVSWN